MGKESQWKWLWKMNIAIKLKCIYWHNKFIASIRTIDVYEFIKDDVSKRVGTSKYEFERSFGH